MALAGAKAFLQRYRVQVRPAREPLPSLLLPSSFSPLPLREKGRAFLILSSLVVPASALPAVGAAGPCLWENAGRAGLDVSAPACNSTRCAGLMLSFAEWGGEYSIARVLLGSLGTIRERVSLTSPSHLAALHQHAPPCPPPKPPSPSLATHSLCRARRWWRSPLAPT